METIRAGEASTQADVAPTVEVRAVSRKPRKSKPDALGAGAKLHRYVILGVCGEGGMGRVYRAYDPQLEREVALKVLLPDAIGAEASSRLKREAQMLARLTHPNVVAVYDAQPHGDELVVVMEFLAGRTLRKWLASKPTPAEIVQVFVKAGRGVAAANRIGIVHRDFKPGNVLIGDDGRVCVLDFGLAQPASMLLSTDGRGPSSHGATSSAAEPEEPLTEPGLILGTPRYMAPEQHLGLPIDPRADVYAFCVALWEALCGRAPFEPARNLDALLAA